MNTYCTLFDSNYLTRGLSLYQSLLDTGEYFHLYIFAFDNYAETYLKSRELPYVTVVSLREFEDKNLLRIKKNRTVAEYCWTCASWSILYVMKRFMPQEVTYLDADIFFFQKPGILLEEFHQSGKDVMITEHRYSPQYDQTKTSGIYNIQFITFKNNTNGRLVLQWWCDRCAEWCYARLEDGKMGDQMYLDDWTTRFQGIHVLQHLGGGVAPWNVQQYKCTSGPKVNDISLVFYHFHSLRWLKDNTFEYAPAYKLSTKIIDYIYIPYINTLQKMLLKINKEYDGSFAGGFFSYDTNMSFELTRLSDDDFNMIKKYPIILVYGAGKIGREVMYRLQIHGINNFSLVVSISEVDGQFVMGKKKISVDEFIADRNCAVILLSVGKKLQEEILIDLKRKGFCHIIIMAQS